MDLSRWVTYNKDGLILLFKSARELDIFLYFFSVLHDMDYRGTATIRHNLTPWAGETSAGSGAGFENSLSAAEHPDSCAEQSAEQSAEH